MNILRDTLQVLAKRWQGLEMTFSVPCPTVEPDGEPCDGRFPLDGMLKRKRKGKHEVSCLRCDEAWSLDRLLTGFDGPDVLVEVREMRKESKAHASEAAARHWALLRALGSEGHLCPGTFTLLPEDLDSWNPLDLGKTAQRLTLWCEHPDHPHPIWPIGTGPRDSDQGQRGEYVFPVANEKLRKIAPLMRTVASTLKLVIPIAGALVRAGLAEALLDDVKPKLELMEKVTRGLLSGEAEDFVKVRETDDFRTHAEGAALRHLHSLLLELDPDRTWGGLRRIMTPTGDYRWLCPQHYKEYDPGLPILPKQT